MRRDLAGLLDTLAAIERERRMEAARRDNLIVQAAREIAAERLAILERHERYEPERRYGHE
jgi:hypothetical protein